MKKIYILDTNVLVHDPECLFKFEDNDIVIPITVVEELDKLKKGHGDIPYSARSALRIIDSLRERGNISKGIKLDNGGTVTVAIDKNYDLCSPVLMDNRIIALAIELSKKKKRTPVILVSKDTAVRIKAEALGVTVQDYRHDKTYIFQQYGMVKEDFDYANGIKSVRYIKKGEEIYRVKGEKNIEQVKKWKNIMGISPKNIEQLCAFDALLNERIDVVALTGKAGTGKTLLALAAGIYLLEKSNARMQALKNQQREQELKNEQYFEQILVARPVIPIVGQDIGFLPGDIEEKLGPWMQPIYDNLDVIIGTPFDTKKEGKPIKYKNSRYLIESGMIQIEPLTYIRGRSLPHRYIIVDEAQNLRPLDVKTIITRCGEGTKVIFTGDLYQIDTPYLDFGSNGLAYLISKFINEENFCYLNLVHSARSKLAERAAELL
jgi:PhoH-like ATPase